MISQKIYNKSRNEVQIVDLVISFYYKITQQGEEYYGI